MYLENGMLILERIFESYQPMHSHYRWEAQVQGRMVISTRSQSKLGGKQACICLFNLFLIGGQLLYNVVLLSAIHWHESATGIHMSSPLWISLPTPTPSHPSRLSQSTGYELPASYSKFPLAVCFIYDNAYVSIKACISSAMVQGAFRFTRLPAPCRWDLCSYWDVTEHMAQCLQQSSVQ